MNNADKYLAIIGRTRRFLGLGSEYLCHQTKDRYPCAWRKYQKLERKAWDKYMEPTA